MNRRKHPRFRLITGLEYRIAKLPDAETLADLDTLMTTHVQDASMGGLGTLLQKFVPAETILEIRLSHAKKPRTQIGVEARVLWCDRSPRPQGGYRAGLEFLNPQDEALEAITALLDKADKTPLE